MITQHIKVFAEIYLEENMRVEGSKLTEFIKKEVRLPVTYNEVLLALSEMCKENKIEEVLATEDFGDYKKVKK